MEEKSADHPLPWEATIFFCSPADDSAERDQNDIAAEVERYVGWIHQHTPCCEPTAYVVAYVYIRRLSERMGGRSFLTSLNFQPVVLLAIMLAAKNLTQRGYNNAYYAMVGGMSTQEMNRLEMELLSALKFDLHVDSEDFESCYAYLECVHREMSSLIKNRPEQVLHQLTPRNYISRQLRCALKEAT